MLQGALRSAFNGSCEGLPKSRPLQESGLPRKLVNEAKPFKSESVAECVIGTRIEARIEALIEALIEARIEARSRKSPGMAPRANAPVRASISVDLDALVLSRETPRTDTFEGTTVTRYSGRALEPMTALLRTVTLLSGTSLCSTSL